MPAQLFNSKAEITARALLIGEQIDLRVLADVQRLSDLPLTVRAGDCGCAVLLRYGAVVLFDLSPVEEMAFLNHLRPIITQPSTKPENEDAQVTVNQTQAEHVTGTGVIMLHELTLERLQVVADILAKSVVLAHYEARIAEAFDRIEPLAQTLRHKGRSGSQGRALQREIGDVLLTQHKMIGRAELGDKPEIIWEHPELERLFARLEYEYDLRERHRALDLKLDLIYRTVNTFVELEQNSLSLRVEWYIVALIIVEILFTIYELFLTH